MPEATLESAGTTTREATLVLPRSGLRLQGGTLYRTGRGGVTIAAHRLAETTRVELTPCFDVPVFVFGLLMAFVALAAKAGMESPVASWAIAIGAGVLACLLMAGARGLVLAVTSAGVTASYRLVDQDEDCQGFVASTTERWRQAHPDEELEPVV